MPGEIITERSPAAKSNNLNISPFHHRRPIPWTQNDFVQRIMTPFLLATVLWICVIPTYEFCFSIFLSHLDIASPKQTKFHKMHHNKFKFYNTLHLPFDSIEIGFARKKLLIVWFKRLFSIYVYVLNWNIRIFYFRLKNR